MFLDFRKSLANFVYPEIQSERRALERLANVDALTSLANRRAFELAEVSANKDSRHWFVLFDANNFGKVNKQFGHEQGDEVLKEIGQAIKEAADCFGLGERVFRLGGDEFVVIVDGQAKAKRLRNMAESNFGFRIIGDLKISIAGVIGTSVADCDQRLQVRKAGMKDENFKSYLDLPD